MFFWCVLFFLHLILRVLGAQTAMLAVMIPAGAAAPEPWHVARASDYKQTTGDNMQFCRNFEG